MGPGLKNILILLFSAGLLCACDGSEDHRDAGGPDTELTGELPAQIYTGYFHYGQSEPRQAGSHSGYYLCGRFAQHNHDWKNAGLFMEKVVAHDPDNSELNKMAMILLMGSGNASGAIEIARGFSEPGVDNSLAQLLLALESFGDERFADALTFLDAMPEGGMSDFINPLLKAWAAASEGRLEIGELPGSPVHSFHAALIAGYLGEYKSIPGIIEKALKSSGINLANMESVGDIYARAGLREEAARAYNSVLKEDPGNAVVALKLKELAGGRNSPLFEKGKISSPKEGIARAVYDMARMLFGEYSNDSARVFAQMALYLEPDMDEARILLAVIDTRNDRYADAIAQYQAVGGKDARTDVRKQAAELMVKVGRGEEAVQLLKELVSNNNDIEAQIQIGDIYRQQEDFAHALEAYDKAESMIGGDVSEKPEYWYLFYARGMVLERLGRWSDAENDLLVALEHQPDHPYVMNYLGYGWTENGIRYDDALALLEKAAAIQPSDGYISDSLGWVYYQKKDYERAIPHLEKAVELLPYDPVINDHLGDAYWRAGRRLEAEFQWRRAKNHSEDEHLSSALSQKLVSGLNERAHIREAKGAAGEGARDYNENSSPR